MFEVFSLKNFWLVVHGVSRLYLDVKVLCYVVKRTITIILTANDMFTINPVSPSNAVLHWSTMEAIAKLSHYLFPTNT